MINDYYAGHRSSNLNLAMLVKLKADYTLVEQLLKEICPRGNNKVIIYFLIS